MKFPCGLSSLDLDSLSTNDCIALAIYHGWYYDENQQGWQNDELSGYLYEDAYAVVDDWSLWQEPDAITGLYLTPELRKL